jgi:hypothetical protein
MNVFKIISVLAVCLTATLVHAQDVELDSYKFGEGLRFTADEGHKIRISGYVQPYAESKQYTEADANESMNRFRMRRLRLRMDGVLPNERFSYRFQVDLSGASEVGDSESSNNYLLDAYVSYNITNRIKLSFGQRSTYTDNRELFMSSRTLQLVERSRLTSAFSSIREFGFFAQGNFRTGGGSYLKPYFVLTNGDGSNAFDKDHGGLKVGGRIDFLPFGLFTNLGQFRQADVMRELIPKIVIGVNYSKNNGMSSRRGRESGSILYLNDANEESLPDYTKYGADFMIKYKGFSMLGEYIKTEADVPKDITQRLRNNGSTSTTFDVNGIQDVENYVKGRMMLGTAYNIQLGYLFKNGFSVDGRYTQLEADDNSFLNNGTFYNRPEYYTIGLGKYLARNYGAKIQASYTYVRANPGINDLNGSPIAGDEWIARLMLTFSL